jgi:hypothetical protein
MAIFSGNDEREPYPKWPPLSYALGVLATSFLIATGAPSALSRIACKKLTLGDVMKMFASRVVTARPIDRDDLRLSAISARTPALLRTLAVCLVTAAMALISNAGHADEETCKKHMADTDPKTHDPQIQVRVELFALQLVNGDMRFAEQWNAYNSELRKGANAPASAPDLPNAEIRQLDAALDLNCYAPREARLSWNADGGLKLDIDDWRSYVTVTAFNLQADKNFTVKKAEDLINKVRREDRAIAAADFSRTCFLAARPYEARADANGVITITEIKETKK